MGRKATGPKMQEIVCARCGKKVKKLAKEVRKSIKRGYKQYCSKQCVSGIQLDKDGLRKCKDCGKLKLLSEFPVWAGNIKHICKECWRNNYYDESRYVHLEKKARERADRIGVYSEKLDYRNILTRDGYICYLCGESVDSRDISFDHVIPLSKSGTHTYDNVKITHKSCNKKKSSLLLKDILCKQKYKLVIEGQLFDKPTLTVALFKSYFIKRQLKPEEIKLLLRKFI